MRLGLNMLHLVPGETGGSELYARRLVPALLSEDPACVSAFSLPMRPRFAAKRALGGRGRDRGRGSRGAQPCAACPGGADSSSRRCPPRRRRPLAQRLHHRSGIPGRPSGYDHPRRGLQAFPGDARWIACEALPCSSRSPLAALDGSSLCRRRRSRTSSASSGSIREGGRHAARAWVTRLRRPCAPRSCGAGTKSEAHRSCLRPPPSARTRTSSGSSRRFRASAARKPRAHRAGLRTPFEEHLQRLARDLPGGDRIRFTGWSTTQRSRASIGLPTASSSRRLRKFSGCPYSRRWRAARRSRARTQVAARGWRRRRPLLRSLSDVSELPMRSNACSGNPRFAST